MTVFRKGGPRAVVAVLLMALVAGCAQEAQRSASGGQFYNRPESRTPPGPPGDPWGPWIRDASRRFDIPEQWIREVMRQESGGRASATSHAGAMGLMQVMPGTYRELQARYNLGTDPYHPYDSIQAGTAYLREMYELYGNPAFLAAYNAGPRRLEDYLWGGRGLPGETRNYVARIGPRIRGVSPNRPAPAEVYAAAEIGTNIPAGPRRMDAGTMMALRQQRQAPAVVQVAAAPPPAAVAPRVQVASLAPVAFAAAPRPTYMQGIENPTLTASARAALAEAARQSEAERAGEPTAVAPAVVAPAVVASALAAPDRRVPAATPFRSFSLVGSAQASTLPRAPVPVPPRAQPQPQRVVARAPAQPSAGGTRWSVQVGAFASENLARTTANQARNVVATLGSRTSVTPVQSGRTRLYRSRVTGLTRSGAEQACERLRTRGDCTVIAPDA